MMASGIVGRPRMMYDQRQPSVPPASAAIPPTIAGLSTAAARAAPATLALTRPRTAIG